MFSCEFSEISKNAFFTEHICVSALDKQLTEDLDRRKNNHRASLCEKVAWFLFTLEWLSNISLSVVPRFLKTYPCVNNWRQRKFKFYVWINFTTHFKFNYIHSSNTATYLLLILRCGLLAKQLSIIFTYKNVYRVALEVEKQWFNVLDSINFN